MRAQTSFIPRQKWALVVVLFLTAVPVFAQVPAATILGVVKDSSGAVAPEAMAHVRPGPARANPARRDCC